MEAIPNRPAARSRDGQKTQEWELDCLSMVSFVVVRVIER